jgi:rSAM/selenodomain-associated transferase 1
MRGDTRGGETLLMMAKYWTPGRVKTRLGASIGMSAAAELHRLFTERLTDALADCGGRRVVLVSPDDRCGEVADAISSRWTSLAQGDGHLGQRMWNGFRRFFEGRDCRVVMIGSDLPTLEKSDIDAAFAALADHDCVFGPAIDGGYYLVGLRGKQSGFAGERSSVAESPSATAGGESVFANLFVELPWGTASVLADSLSIAAANGLRVAMLGQREDVDTWADLVRLLARLERSDNSDHTSLASRIRAVLGRHAISVSDLPPV